jgi:hypothetical protein
VAVADVDPEIDALELDALWAEFHGVVNMTSQELAAWLRAGGTTREGEGVLGILRKREMDLTDADVALMYDVVDTVEAERAAGPRAGLPEPGWRQRLMTLGHDPLRSSP